MMEFIISQWVLVKVSVIVWSGAIQGKPQDVHPSSAYVSSFDRPDGPDGCQQSADILNATTRHGDGQLFACVEVNISKRER